MRSKNYGVNLTLIVLFLSLLIISAGCGRGGTGETETGYGHEKQKQADSGGGIKDNEIAVSAPPFSEGIFPCSVCHAKMVVNKTRRELKFHQEIDEMYSHDKENRWCLDCHNAEKRDSLHLASGKTVDFKESYKLCGQCHGDKLRDWKVGVHGQRTGEWNGKKQYLLCVHCHNPHAPKFQNVKPEPPPVRPENIMN